MRILHVASEVAPWAQTGGLADVVAALPAAVAAQSASVTNAIVVPLHRGVVERVAAAGRTLDDPGVVVTADLAGATWHGRFRVLADGASPIWFLECPPLYDRDGLYGPATGGDHPDNAVRFAFLCRAAVDHGARIMSGVPDVLHVHDWQAGLAAAYLRTSAGAGADARRRTGTVCTVHNLAFRGVFPKAMVPALGLPWSAFTMQRFEFWDQLSTLKAGLAFADAATTVSPSYAHEIMTPELGEGLHDFLRWHVPRLVGIVNGIDTTVWDPATDPAIAASFSAAAPAGKARCRAALAADAGLAIEDTTLLVGMVSRLTHHKGVDLVAELVPELAAAGAKLVVLGSGEPTLEDRLRWLAARFRDHFALRLGFDPAMARRIYAGADAVLVPSRFEPCGLTQLYAMRYGAVPIVHAVGGLRDTVHDPGDLALAGGGGTGIRFDQADAIAMQAAVARAARLFREHAGWQRIVLAAMRRDSSWGPSAREYLQLYRAVVRERQ